LIEQDKYLKSKVRILKKLLRAYNKNKKKLIFALLMLTIYDMITIAKVFLFLVVYLEIEIIILISLIIDYRNEFTNFAHFVSKT